MATAQLATMRRQRRRAGKRRQAPAGTARGGAAAAVGAGLLALASQAQRSARPRPALCGPPARRVPGPGARAAVAEGSYGWEAYDPSRLPATLALRDGEAEFSDVPVLDAEMIPPEVWQDAAWARTPFVLRGSAAMAASRAPAARRAVREAAEQHNLSVAVGHSWSIAQNGGEGPRRILLRDYLDRLMHESWHDGDTQLEPAYAFDRGLQIEGLPSGDDVHPLLRSWNRSAFQVGSGASRLTMLGGPGSAVGWHRHGSSAQMMLHGRKRWLFYPLDRYPPGDGPGGGFSLSDWLRVVYPMLTRNQRPLECIQLPGDIVYVPEGWYHAVINLADSVAVAVQNEHCVDRPTEALKGVSLGYVRHLRQSQPKVLTALAREARELMHLYPNSDLHARKVLFYTTMDTSPEEAAEVLLEGTAKDPFHVPMQYEMAVWLHGRAKDGDEFALRTFQRAMDAWEPHLLKNTRNLKALWILDRYYGLMGQQDLARHYHERLVDLHSRGIDR